MIERSSHDAGGNPSDASSYERMSALAKERVSKKRFKHMEGVAQTAEQLARFYGTDPGRARLAGILHDWDKDLDNDQIRDKVHALGIQGEVGEWVVCNMPQVLHGPTAAAELERRFPGIPSEVISAIRKHTIASREMSDLDKIIYIADALEPGRRFDAVRKLRGMMGVASLDELYFEVYRFWIQALVGKGCLLHPDTLMIWNGLAYPRAHERLLAYEKRNEEKEHG